MVMPDVWKKVGEKRVGGAEEVSFYNEEENCSIIVRRFTSPGGKCLMGHTHREGETVWHVLFAQDAKPDDSLAPARVWEFTGDGEAIGFITWLKDNYRSIPRPSAYERASAIKKAVELSKSQLDDEGAAKMLEIIRALRPQLADAQVVEELAKLVDGPDAEPPRRVDAVLTFTEAGLLATLGRHDEALGLLSAIEWWDAARLLKARVLAAAGRLDEAEAEAVLVNARDLETWVAKLVVLAGAGKYERALSLIEEGASFPQRWQNDEAASISLAACLVVLSELQDALGVEKALAASEGLLNVVGGEAPLLAKHIELLWKAGRREEAKRVFAEHPEVKDYWGMSPVDWEAVREAEEAKSAGLWLA